MRRFGLLLAGIVLGLLTIRHFAPSPPPQALRATRQVESTARANQPDPAPANPSRRPIPARRTLPAGSEADWVLPPLNHAKLLEAARHKERQGRYLFATSRQVDIAPHLAGRWEVEDQTARWRCHLRSPGALSLNLAFSEFHLPPTATLTLSDPRGSASPITFTSRDNDAHGQLWTPLLQTDELLVTVEIPTGLTSDLRLKLCQVNHGFRPSCADKFSKAIGNSTSGSCNIDVICSAADDPNFGPLVDLYRDQIRSVAAYTLGGIETCSGALINNARNDLTPYFLTADHCSINPSNAASIVVYWNFENSTCRTPNTSISGANGDGPITQFNSGSTFRAARAASDFCLIELDDPVDPSFNPFFSGWNRSGDNPATSVAIHHPGVSEKRISFELDPTTTTSYSGTTSNPNETHVRVADWDFGTTEGGSSGSPLFDDGGHIIGQLHGGSAACGNDLPDWYGRLSRSWSDGSSASERLSDWLDPDQSAGLTLAGINSKALLTVSDASVTEGNSSTSAAEFTVTLSEKVDEPVSVTLRTVEESATNDDFIAIDRQLTFEPSQTELNLTVLISGDLLPEENETFQLVLSNPTNAVTSSQPGRVTILNDDFITPEIDSSLAVQAVVNSPFEYRLTALNTPTSFAIADAPTGMTIDAQTGVLSWTPTAVGPATVTLIASNPAGSDSRTLTVTVTPNDLTAALDLSQGIAINNGSPGWSLQTVTTSDGIDAARTDPISDSQSADFSIAVTGPDLLDYQYKVSSESGYDFLTVSLDGLETSSFSGEIDWTSGTLSIPTGPHTVTFRYQKDSSLSRGEDSAWLDAFTLAGSTGRPAIVSAADLTIDSGSQITYLIESIAPEAVFSVSSLPTGLTFDGDRTISGQLDTPGDSSFEITATANGQEDSLTVRLRVATPVGEAVELTNLPWTREGDSIWFGQSEVTFDGEDAAQSGDSNHSESSSMSITVTGPDRLSFQWKVSSELNFDELSFLLDGQPFEAVPPISGEQDWSAVHASIPSGTHVLSWRYAKDGSVDGGQDAAWLDDLRFASGFRPMIWTPPAPLLLVGIPSNTPLEFINAESFETSTLPAWLSYDEESESLSGTPPATGSYPIEASATGFGETTTQSLTLTVVEPSPALADTLGQPELAVVSRGAAPWGVETDAELAAARSGAITDNEQSSMTLLVEGPGTLGFRWMVSSEEIYDLLRYSLNDIPGDEISGETAWQPVEIVLSPGRNKLTWTYEKDGSLFEGEDLGRIADLTLGGYARFLLDREFDPYTVTPDGDPDDNGFSVLYEYAFPTPSAAGFQTSPLTLSSAPDEATLEFDGVLPNDEIEYRIESSPDLNATSWQRVPGGFQTTPNGSTARYRFAIPVPQNDRDQQFFRVRARFD